MVVGTGRGRELPTIIDSLVRKSAEAQKKAIYDSGFDGLVLWEPGSRYDSFIPAFEKTLVSRKKNPPVARPSNKLD